MVLVALVLVAIIIVRNNTFRAGGGGCIVNSKGISKRLDSVCCKERVDVMRFLARSKIFSSLLDTIKRKGNVGAKSLRTSHVPI
jgi:hypothetical protein